ncbi:hypothetical protein [Zoogloea sp.]|uniref:hypothetical protein n=1 Tax=Zoogloea sp. TaxID=49181 RepID=UPI0035B10CF0
MSDPRRRRERLLQLLPRIYTAQPERSAVGAVVSGMATSLASLDDALTRVQYDRWVGLASTQRRDVEDASAVEQLGQLLQVARLPPRLNHAGYDLPSPDRLEVRFDHTAPLDEALTELIGEGWRRPRNGRPPLDPAEALGALFPGLTFTLGSDERSLSVTAGNMASSDDLAPFRAVLDPEPGETYRQRLLVTAKVRTGGLATPRALLSLAIADLGAEPCPRLQRRQDSTLAFGMPPGTRKRCSACSGKGDMPCPNRSKAVIEAWLTENPSLPASHAESAPRLRRPFSIDNPSLHPDRPVLSLTISEQPAAYPAIRSIDTGEITLYAGTVKPGETLVLYPAVTPAEAAPFDGFDAPGHHAWLSAHPTGQALLIGPDGSERDVSHSIFYLWGNRFDDPQSALGAMRCGVLDQRVLTPRLQRGSNRWMLLSFAQPDAEFADATTTVHTSRFAGHDDVGGTSFALLDGSISRSDSRYASILFESFSKTDTGSASEETTANAPRLSLRLDWMSRPPASYRLRIPKTGWVAAAAARGALKLVRSDISRATAAGVRPMLDFPEPPHREDVMPADGLAALAIAQRWTEDAAPADGGLQTGLGLTARERHEPAEGCFSMQVVFDTTRLDWSHAG